MPVDATAICALGTAVPHAWGEERTLGVGLTADTSAIGLLAAPIPPCPTCGETEYWEMVEQYEFSRLMAYSLRGDGRWQEDQTDHAEDENEEDDSGAADTTITCAACQTDLVGFGELWEQMKNRDFYWPDLEE